jgi:hypothetical protein
MSNSSIVSVSQLELEVIGGGSDLWPTVKCLLMPWRDVIDGFSCEGVR